MGNPDEPHEVLVEHARALLDGNRYLTLGTVSAGGGPWVSPVYFAPRPGWEFLWVSEVDTVHSRNLAARPGVSLVVFDSTVPAYHGRAVYAVGEAREVPPDALDDVLSDFPGPPGRGGNALTRDDLVGGSPWRLYRATASDLWVLCPREPRQACALHGIDRDHRARVL